MEKIVNQALEFKRVLEVVGEYAKRTDTARELTNLTLIDNYHELQGEFETLTETIEFLKYDGGIDLGEVEELSPYLEKIHLVGYFLQPEELWSININLRTLRIFLKELYELEKYPKLEGTFKKLRDYRHIEQAIEKIIDKSGVVKDDASLNLKEIRHHQKLVNTNIKEKFEALFNDPQKARAIQERLITTRDGRSVVPIKADFKGQIKGIEHDRSASGQTIFLEPLNVVSLNNKVRELKVREREELRKLLLQITEFLRVNIEELAEAEKALKRIDFLTAKAKYSLEIEGNIPVLSKKPELSLINARHPFIDKTEMIPLTLELGSEFKSLLITGPNTGGKTVTLKTIGLLVLMARVGIPIPAGEKSVVGMFDKVYADIGDEQSIEQSLSSFSAHLKNIKEITEGLTSRSLILLDELGSGTDPVEGSAFAIGVIEFLLKKKCVSMISTHYSEVKAYGYNKNEVQTASMEFDLDTLTPTYHLLLGVPGESNALIIARRMGVTEEILEKAKEYISDDNKKVEKMIANIKDQSKHLEEVEEKTKGIILENERLKREYQEKLQELKNKEQAILKEAYEQTEKIISSFEGKATGIYEKLRRETTQKEEAKELQKSLTMLRKALKEEKTEKVVEPKKIKRKTTLKEGDEVFVKSINQNAVITKVLASKEALRIQAGILKLEVDFSDAKKIAKKEMTSIGRPQIKRQRGATTSLDLRGKTKEEALYELENYLDSALLRGYIQVSIIHGKGTGVLMKGVMDYLRNSPYVKDFRAGGPGEGGTGCTVVELK